MRSCEDAMNMHSSMNRESMVSPRRLATSTAMSTLCRSIGSYFAGGHRHESQGAYRIHKHLHIVHRDSHRPRHVVILRRAILQHGHGLREELTPDIFALQIWSHAQHSYMYSSRRNFLLVPTTFERMYIFLYT